MNKHQKLVQQAFLNKEGIIIKRLEAVYSQSLKDINKSISYLDSSIASLTKAYNSITDNDIGALASAFLKNKKHLTPEQAKETLQSMIQSKVYQKNYQAALKKQVGDILDTMQDKQYKNIADYLDECYEDGFIGAMYDLHGQGIPLCFPLDQESMVRAVQTNSKISNGLYKKLGEDVSALKKNITAEVSRGISSGMTYSQVAKQIKAKMTGIYNTPGGALYRAMTIARTEGHRIQVQSAMDACKQAKDAGADIVKQWDSTMDKRTRKSHAHVDGEIRELDEAFSNGLQYPGDPDGGAAEVVNCRCALLQRAKWALDDEELETLKQRAAYFGLDKNDSFDDFKQKYIDAVSAEPAKPKKEYLTKKKLEQYIADGTPQLEDLHEQFKTASGGWTYDEVIKDFGSLEDFTDGDDLKKLKALKQQADDLQAQIDDWQEKLDKKIIVAETKKLTKEQIALQDQLNNFNTKTYSNIWKDDVDTKDWAIKQHSIAAKKQYFENKLLQATDAADKAKWQSLLDDLDDFDKNGKAYNDINSKLQIVNNNLKSLQNKSGIIKGKKDDAFSQQRKDNAYWFTPKNDRGNSQNPGKNGAFQAADAYFDPPAKQIHSAATPAEHDGFYTYTSSSGGHNRPLAGFQKPWNQPGRGWEQQYYVGAKNVWIDYEGKGDQIRGLTTLIEKSTYPDDVWLQSGQDFQTLEGFLKIPYGSLSTMSDADMQQFVGRRDVMYSFISTAVNKGGGSTFNAKPMKINFYAPKGSQMLYASDVGAFGKGENEMILQRGGTYEITKIYWGIDDTDNGRRKIFVDMEIHPEVGYDLFQQDPNEWKGSRKNCRS